MSASVEKLKAARELVARPGGWTQEAFARDDEGQQTQSRSRDAVCWCAEGALKASRSGFAEFDFLQKLLGLPIAVWNDEPGRTQADVVAAFDRAIALAEAHP